MGFSETKLLILLLLVSEGAMAQVKLSGLVREKSSSENIPFVNVSLKGLAIGTSSNGYGFYSIGMPANVDLEILFSSIGYTTCHLKGKFTKDTVVNIEMTISIEELEEVVVVGNTAESMAKDNGHTQLPIGVVRQMPALLGEKDVLKTIQFLPGIQRGAEGSTALYVRGGGPDQNLIILDGAQFYNAGHLFGFFSAFNGDAIKSVDFWKAGFPARYGGRLSSIIDMQMKDGSREKLQGEGGIGLTSTRLTIEGPIQKNKSSFLISTRRSYLDLITRPFMSSSNHQSYVFYDLNTKANVDIDFRNKLMVSGYLGNDRLKVIEKVTRPQSTIHSAAELGWRNSALSFRWNHIVSKRVFISSSLLYSKFNFNLSDEFERTGNSPRAEFTEYVSSIQDYSAKSDLDFFANNRHQFKGGLVITNHTYMPKAYQMQNRLENADTKTIEKYVNQEFGLYAEGLWKIRAFNLQYGARISALNTPYKFFRYVEPRAMASYEILENFKINGSYTRANQFVHLLSNTGIGLSTDLWVPATLKAPPQQADQFSFGAIKNLPKLGLTLSVETYRKYLRNVIAYTEEASFLVIDQGPKDISWEDNITKGKGLSYGNEILIQKTSGKFTGWIGYTLSWTVHQFDSLNNGQKFYPKQDSRHNISTVLSYRASPKIMVSANWTYNTGNALTAPHGYYFTNTADFATNSYHTSVVPYFGARNSFRAEPYHRLDIAVQFHKQKKRYSRYWEFGLYNAYNRKNPFYYYLQPKSAPELGGQIIEIKKRALLPIIPSVTYNFKF